MRWAMLCVCAVLLWGPADAAAQATGFPERPVRIVVPFAPGGFADIMARILAERAGRDIPNKFIVENRSGASGNVGMEAVARAAPDGYTLGQCGVSNCAINPAIYARMPFEMAELQPVFWAVSSLNVLVVRNDLPVRTLTEFLDYARRNPGRLSYGSSGFGSSNHLAPEMLRGVYRVDWLHVPFRGGAPALQAVLGGQVDFMLEGTATLVTAIRDGRVRALGVTGLSRDPALPEVPTFAEAGVPDFVVEPWNGFVAPRGTPDAVVARLNALFNEALADEAVRARIADLGARPEGGSAARFADHLRREVERWRRVVEVNGVERLQ